ncbi:hypothetical protein [Paraburkholderia heleia]|uniref:hypothetical protein n=1 Tax=Paraburkholderia heleia TaxID=634127 RepID=UPI002AB6B44F|nr:hypothetical protein [Paraburkholderia heleia]
MDASTASVQQAYAAWVQAVGSIIAIAVAIYVPFQQGRRELRLRELHYWSERADIERRILLIANEVAKFVQRLIEESVPAQGATRICTYYPTIHQELWDRITALEARDIGDSGHDRVATMRSVLLQLQSMYPSHTGKSISPGSPFSQELAQGRAAQDARACQDESEEALDRARSKIKKLNGNG